MEKMPGLVVKHQKQGEFRHCHWKYFDENGGERKKFRREIELHLNKS